MNVYCLSQSLLSTEWLTIKGEKYANALPFKIDVVDAIEQEYVIAWDGIITPKNQSRISHVIEYLQKGKVLLFQSEAKSLLADHPLISGIDLKDINYVELNGWTVLPEELLKALEQCHQKMKNV